MIKINKREFSKTVVECFNDCKTYHDLKKRKYIMIKIINQYFKFETDLMKYKTNEIKKDFIKYRVTKEEKEIIFNRAKEYNMDMSNYIRYLIDKDLKNK